MTPINIAIADDQYVIREGLEKALKSTNEINVLLVAQNGKELIDSVSQQAQVPDVIIMDIEMPEMNGFAATEMILKHFPKTRVLFLTGHAEPSFIQTAIKSGGHGYISKYENINNIVQAIKEVFEEGYYFNDLVSLHTIREYFRDDDPNFNFKTMEVLDAREIHLIRLLCNEDTEEDIARQLSITKEQLEAKIQHIMDKLSVKKRIGLIIYGYRNGIYVP
ncbi:MAG: response regulator [Bacteroidia bacterium]